MDKNKLLDEIKSFEEYKLFCKNFEENAFAHSFLITSIDHTLALEFAKALALFVCGSIKNLNSDCFVFGDGKKGSFLTENCNALIRESFLKPMNSEYKIFIIDGGNLSQIVQNKLLKTIEEPPKNTIFFFIGSDQSQFLPTILSRCQKINLGLLKKDQFKNCGFGQDLFLKSGGNLDFAQKFESKKFAIKFDFVVDMLKNMQKSSDVVKYSKKLAKDKDEFGQTLEILQTIFYLMLQANTAKFEFFDKDLFDEFDAKTICFVVDEILIAQKKFEFNCNVSAICDCLFLKILEVKFKCKKGLL